MSWRKASASLVLLFLFLFSTQVERVYGDAMVVGSVFCDRCGDGRKSILDYPLVGARVALTCVGNNGEMVGIKEQRTTLMGAYAIRFNGSPDLNLCTAKVVGGPRACGVGSRWAHGLKLLFRMYGLEIYTVDPLFAQPALPLAICKKPTSSIPRAVSVAPAPTPVPMTAPVFRPSEPALPPSFYSHPIHVAPQPSIPPPRNSPIVAPLPTFACPYKKWAMPKYRCYWRGATPNTRVSAIFGVDAGRRYGGDITLWEALHESGNVYNTLLREATTALLNSYYNTHFFYNTSVVVNLMDKALTGSSHDAVEIAMGFKKANHGDVNYGAATCDFRTCL